MRFGIIGTNSISHTFMRAAQLHSDFCLTAVYSRTQEAGWEFAKQYGVDTVYTSLEELANSPLIEAVYIASPNSCHKDQAVLMLNGKKHVLCEKPIASDARELRTMLRTAEENGVILMEAMRSAYDPGFYKLKELLPLIGKPRLALFQYCQYSSRYDKFKEGTILNAFNPALSNAAVMDIGVYCIHPMVRLFGKPRALLCKSTFLENGMEGMGSVIADYGEMQVVLQYSKICDSHLPSQIQGEDGTLVISEIQNPKKIQLYRRNGPTEIYDIKKEDNNIYYEIGEFLTLAMNGRDGSENNRYSEMEMEVMDQVRAIAGIGWGKK